jgi:hypothetical protein
MASIIWLIVWLAHGHPWLLSHWTAWNACLLACVALDLTGISSFFPGALLAVFVWRRINRRWRGRLRQGMPR